MNKIVLPIFISTILIFLVGCNKKEVNQPINLKQATDFRDSLIGNYNCLTHYSTMANHGASSTDTVIGSANISISKYASDDSSLILNGDIFSISNASPSTLNYTSVTYPGKMLTLYPHSESIYYLYNTGTFGYDGAYAYYDVGSK